MGGGGCSNDNKRDNSVNRRTEQKIRSKAEHRFSLAPKTRPSESAGCKENHFYSLPFGQAEANIY